MGYKRLKKVTGGYKGLQGERGSYSRLERATEG